MTDSGNTASSEAATASNQPVAASASASWAQAPSAQGTAAGLAAEHPELIIGAAFAGGLMLAAILKRLGG